MALINEHLEPFQRQMAAMEYDNHVPPAQCPGNWPPGYTFHERAVNGYTLMLETPDCIVAITPEPNESPKRVKMRAREHAWSLYASPNRVRMFSEAQSDALVREVMRRDRVPFERHIDDCDPLDYLRRRFANWTKDVEIRR